MRISLPRKPSRAPGVTAVIPCYNYGRYLGAATASVLAQPGIDPRVIIVDDCSTDDSLAVARSLATDDPRISVISHEFNCGHIATYNDGLDAVKTEYVILISADDLVAPGALGRAATLLDTHPRVGMVYGQPVEFSGESPTSDRDSRAPLTWTRWRGHEWIRLACARGRNFILSPEVVLRTAAVRQIGGYRPEHPKSGDLEYWLRTAAEWDVGRINGRVQAFYRQHESNMHRVEYSTMALDLRHRLEAFRTLENTSLPASLVDRSRRALAREALTLAERELDSGGRRDVARDLVEAAIDIRPLGGSTNRIRIRRLRLRLDRPNPEPRIFPNGIRESARVFADRIRWRLWVHTGVS
ncbi:MAG: glycosyltransferase family 2 protein [Microbacteriaceae bacterium]|nr:glycosyltransferase family 2 protein [Microbacteriaceae bacterium]